MRLLAIVVQPSRRPRALSRHSCALRTCSKLRAGSRDQRRIDVTQAALASVTVVVVAVCTLVAVALVVVVVVLGLLRHLRL